MAYHQHENTTGIPGGLPWEILLKSKCKILLIQLCTDLPQGLLLSSLSMDSHQCGWRFAWQFKGKTQSTNITYLNLMITTLA